LILIRVNVDHKESIAIIEKREINNVSVVKDVLFERESYCYESRLKGLSQETTLVLE